MKPSINQQLNQGTVKLVHFNVLLPGVSSSVGMEMLAQ